MFGAVFNLNILQESCLVLGHIGCLVLWINIHSLVLLPNVRSFWKGSRIYVAMGIILIDRVNAA